MLFAPPRSPRIGVLHVLRLVLLAAGLFVASAAPQAAPAARFSFDATPGNLPKQARPLHYALALTLDPAVEQFAGEARIELVLSAAMPELVLHAKDLSAGRITLQGPSGPARELDAVVDAAAGLWRLRPRDGTALAPGRYTLQLAWTGTVEKTGQGLFVVPYESPDGPQRILATQFEARHARRMLPCFDEPAFRASFALQVDAPTGYEVLSNTPVARREARGATTRWQFVRTPPMPSYLLAVSVGRFEHAETTIDGVRVGVVTTVGKRAQAQFALAAMREVLPYYRRYFGVRYPLPKLDLLAVPGVRDGAMEDWGLISFEESALLVDPADTPALRRHLIYGLIAHEVAHQWFGNLVTAAWWDEIWLNEAFATWLATKTTVHFHPEWQRATVQRLDRQDALERDATPATRAIRSGPVDEDSVFDVFDEITYDKGGAVLTMLEDWLGPQRFRAGLARYMHERRYSNATAQDLWHHLAAAAPGRDVGAVVASWTDQPGYPLIEVERRCVQGRTELQLVQSPFRLSAFDRPGRWQVPLRIRHGTVQHRLLLDAESTQLHLPGCSVLPVVNSGDVGFFRVRYGADDARTLAAGLETLPERDRLMLLDDALALSQAGLQPIGLYLDSIARLPALPGDAAIVPALQAVVGLRVIDQAFIGTPHSAATRAFARGVFAPLLARIGWRADAREAPLVTRLRGELIEQLGRAGDAQVRAKASAQARAALAGGPEIEPGIRGAVLIAAAAGADLGSVDALAAALRREARDERRWELARALGSVQDAAAVDAALALALDESLPANVMRRVPSWLSIRSGQPERVYAFALDRFAALAARAPEWGRPWVLPGAAQGSAQPEAATRLIADQQAKLGTPGQSAAEQVAATIRLRAAFVAREAATIEAAMRAGTPAPALAR